jgi:hypothetical protein
MVAALHHVNGSGLKLSTVLSFPCSKALTPFVILHRTRYNMDRTILIT